MLPSLCFLASPLRMICAISGLFSSLLVGGSSARLVAAHFRDQIIKLALNAVHSCAQFLCCVHGGRVGSGSFSCRGNNLGGGSAWCLGSECVNGRRRHVARHGAGHVSGRRGRRDEATRRTHRRAGGERKRRLFHGRRRGQLRQRWSHRSFGMVRV